MDPSTSRALGNLGRAGRVAVEIAEGGPQGLECARVQHSTYFSFFQGRIPVALVGFGEDNRCGLGLCSSHVHDVAWSCNGANKGVVLVRYTVVNLVRVPADQLESFRELNKDKCESDSFMPRFSPEMKYACLTKSHFCHAMKLREDGGRYLYNDGKTLICKQRDQEGSEDRLIAEQGVVAQIFKSELYNDKEAMLAIMTTDNDDADVEMGEDEIQAQGRIESAITTITKRTGTGEKPTKQNVLAYVKGSGPGLRHWSEAQFTYFIDFRLSIHPDVASVFRTLLFQIVNGRVCVHPIDYFHVATFDSRCNWTLPRTPGSLMAPGALRVVLLRNRYDSLGMPTCCIGDPIRK